jgi:GNAT superfamily N-acetyltransferase
MENKRLKTRLNNCKEWIEYASTSKNFGTILNGLGNMDIYRTNFNQVNDTPYEGLTVRLFNPKTHLWSLYWVDSNLGVLDPPVVGSFEGAVGTFYCKDVFQGKPILVMFQWDKTDPDNPVWAQAFSPDNGVTWEMNLTNVSHEDVEALSQLFDDYRIFYEYTSDLQNGRTFLRERIDNNESVIFIAKSQEGVMIGFVQLYPLFSSTRMKRLWLLNDLFVTPAFRGLKVSILLLTAAKQLAKETQSAGIILETAKSNFIGNKLYVETDFILDNSHNYYSWTY